MKRARAGVTLLEVMVATSILSAMALMIYTAFSHTDRMRRSLGARQEQDHLARTAVNRIARDIRSAFLSAHVNTNPQLVATITAFVGRDQGGGDRVDMTTFTHRRLVRNTHEGDACEVGYRVEARRGGDGRTMDLLRRESPRIDNDPLRGGTVDVLVPDIVDFQIRYYDNATETWVDGWDSMDDPSQKGRLPSRVRVTITMRSGENATQRYMTETVPMIPDVLRFGLPIDYR